MKEIQVPSLGREDPLEKEIATHSSIPAWSLMGNPKDRGVWQASQSIVSQRVEQDWVSEHRQLASLSHASKGHFLQAHMII